VFNGVRAEASSNAIGAGTPKLMASIPTWMRSRKMRAAAPDCVKRETVLQYRLRFVKVIAASPGSLGHSEATVSARGCLVVPGRHRWPSGIWRSVPRTRLPGGIGHSGHSSQDDAVRRTKNAIVAAAHFRSKVISRRAISRSGIRFHLSHEIAICRTEIRASHHRCHCSVRRMHRRRTARIVISSDCGDSPA
jgi:hypothetical protein